MLSFPPLLKETGSPFFPLLLFLIVACHVATPCDGESSTCLTVYKQGGAPAVLRSPKCPRWSLANYDSTPTPSPPCQLAMQQGRRRSQEDRSLCVLDVPVRFPGKDGVKEVMVGIAAVFDGHNGAEASEMASALLLEYFALHTYFLLDAAYSFVAKKSMNKLTTVGDECDKCDEDFSFAWPNWNGRLVLDLDKFQFSFPANFDDSFHLEILKEALLRTIHDIDAAFSKEAHRKGLDSGTTATIALMASGQVLVANIGDSKALLCSKKFQSPAEAKATLLKLYMEKRRRGFVFPKSVYDNMKSAASNGFTYYSVEELTRDHHPHRDDERSRVEAAGGGILEWNGIFRVNGELAVSRAIGDVNFKSYGVISTPELTDWQPVTVNDSYLVVASDGIFEKLSLQDACDILSAGQTCSSERSGGSSCAFSLAEHLVNSAYEMGSMDNMAAVVVPLEKGGRIPQNVLDERDVYSSFVGHGDHHASKSNSQLVELKHQHPITSKFDRLLVEKDEGVLGCYYLSENLDERVHLLQTQKNDQAGYGEYLVQALPGALNYHSGGPLNLYNDLNFCLQLGLTGDQAEDQCINPEGFSGLLGLLESIPFHAAGSDYGSTGQETPDFRYKLKKRFDRGAYGEVWLALHWNCHQDNQAFHRNGSNIQYDTSCFNSTFRNSSGATIHDLNATFDDGNPFILKRIMVERGSAFYLSGLREKHFGEVFLKASRCLGVSSSDWLTDFSSEGFESDFFDVLQAHDLGYELKRSWNHKDTLFDSPQKVIFEEGLNHIARYVESFESKTNEIWLVFRHEGISLSKLMYTVELIDVEPNEEKGDESSQFNILHPSKYWHWLKTTEAGKEEMRYIMWQLLMGLKSCHDRNITHRDVKPENMVICLEDRNTGQCLGRAPSADENYTLKMRIIDFGSALDEFTIKHLYGSTGPSRAEQTFEYSPPEAYLNATWYLGSRRTNLKYDMWSVGVVFLELILGSPNVFQISARTRTLLEPHIKGWSEELKELAYKLRSLMELCILMPGNPSKHYHKMHREGVSPASWKCSEEFFSLQIKSRDPLKLGFPNILALRLVRRLLSWDPDDRLSVDDALEHPYFQPPPKG